MAAARLLGKVLVLGVSAVVCCVGVAAPVTAASGTTVHIEADTSFDPTAVNTFTSDIADCESGAVTEERVLFGGGRGPFGTFTGRKVFACDSGETFTLLLNARFPVGPGSVGSWTVLSASDGLDFSRGSGKLLGFGSDDGVLDVYDGTVR